MAQQDGNSAVDSSGVRCVRCDRGFTGGRKRHHCRKCNEIVCEDCSSYKTIMEKKKSRICSVCALDNGGNLTPEWKKCVGRVWIGNFSQTSRANLRISLHVFEVVDETLSAVVMVHQISSERAALMTFIVQGDIPFRFDGTLKLNPEKWLHKPTDNESGISQMFILCGTFCDDFRLFSGAVMILDSQSRTPRGIANVELKMSDEISFLVGVDVIPTPQFKKENDFRDLVGVVCQSKAAKLGEVYIRWNNMGKSVPLMFGVQVQFLDTTQPPEILQQRARASTLEQIIDESDFTPIVENSSQVPQPNQSTPQLSFSSQKLQKKGWLGTHRCRLCHGISLLMGISVSISVLVLTQTNEMSENGFWWLLVIFSGICFIICTLSYVPSLSETKTFELSKSPNSYQTLNDLNLVT